MPPPSSSRSGRCPPRRVRGAAQPRSRRRPPPVTGGGRRGGRAAGPPALPPPRSRRARGSPRGRGTLPAHPRRSLACRTGAGGPRPLLGRPTSPGPALGAGRPEGRGDLARCLSRLTLPRRAVAGTAEDKLIRFCGLVGNDKDERPAPL